MKTQKLDRGDCYERVKHSPLEKALADEWEKANQRNRHINYGFGILQDLFARPHETFGHRLPHFVHIVTEKERWVVATVIQWLGTNCGQSFLTEAFKKAGFKIVRIEE